MNDPLKFLHEYCDFSNPHWVWIMTGLSRNKDNDESGVKFLRRLVITSPDDIETCRDEIHSLADDLMTTYRLYISLNARDVVNAAFMFQKKLIDISVGLAKGQEDALNLSKKVGSLWKTELAQMHNRATKRFLLDIDNNDELMLAAVATYMAKIGVVIRAQRSTVSGYHLVFDACDTRGLMSFCIAQGIPADVQRDSMVFVEQWRADL